MKKFDELQIGSFLKYNFWEDAFDLLEAQLTLKNGDDKKKIHPSRHFNTINFFYFNKFNNAVKKLRNPKYFYSTIASNIFYGLTNEVFYYYYPLQKKDGFGIRKYSFFSYPQLLTYYSIGLYILKLTQEYLTDIGYLFKIDDDDLEKKRVLAFYGGRLYYVEKEGKTQLPNLGYEQLYYWKYYLKYRSLILKQTKSNQKNRAIITLDVQNYFENISIPILLSHLDDKNRIDHSLKKKLNFNENTKRLIEFYFLFLSEQSTGIPQSDNNAISSFIGYLYLVFGDNYISDIISNFCNPKGAEISNFKIFRYVDDIYISIDFTEKVEKIEKERILLQIISEISETFYSKLNLRFNQKSDIFFIEDKEDKQRLEKSLRRVSGTPDNIIERLELRKRFRKTRIKKGRKKEPKDKLLELPDPSYSIKELQDKFSIIFTPKNNLKIKKRVREISKMKGPSFKIELIFLELEKLVLNSKEGLLKAKKELDSEHLKLLYGKTSGEGKAIQNLLNKKDNKLRLINLISQLDFELVKLNPHILIVLIIHSNDKQLIRFSNHLSQKKQITIADTDVIIKFLCQQNFDLNKYRSLKNKLKNNEFFHPIINQYSQRKVIPNDAGYFNLNRKTIHSLSNKLIVIEQIRLRNYQEKIGSYSIALNHLVNELQSICFELDLVYQKVGKLKNYDRENVIHFLQSHNCPSDIIPTIKNMFKRRNINQISHAGNDETIAYAVNSEEYFDYKTTVEGCLQHLAPLIIKEIKNSV